MSRTARVALPWGDGRHPFRLGIDELDELDQLCQVGPGHLLAKVTAGVYGPWRARELRETIRLGLIGGGMNPNRAILLMEKYFDDTDRYPVGDHLLTAQAILMAAVVGDEQDDDLGEREGEGTAESLSPTAASALEPSGKSPGPSASPTSASSASGSSIAPIAVGSAPTSPRKPAAKAP